MQAWLGGAGGPVIARQEIDEFTLASQATACAGVVETFPDRVKLLRANLHMESKVEGLTVDPAHHRHPKTR